LPKVLADGNRTRPVLAQLLWSTVVGQEPSSTVTVQLVPAGAGVALIVEDRTATLLPEERATLFEPFGSRLARGAGLSLAALRRVMLGQGGQVSAEPAGTGTLFTLTFAPAPA
jgi:C4-dicarboxylate-specific signal transduction histidine kinase